MQYRSSKQRKRILELLRSTDTHPTASWIYDQLKGEFPALSLGTVYRNLRILQEQGEITHLDFGSTFDRFDGRMEPHYHFVCERCGKVMDVMMPVLSDMETFSCPQVKGKVLRHRIEFFGICQDCLKQD
ncbi:MAG: transcriptional repressor [Spirochaetes bacterium]|nr:transcriptional repressor [Spirochaetota bacterium]